MSSNTWVNVGAAVVGGVLAFVTFGASAVLTGVALGYAAASLIQGPEAPGDGGLRPDEFQVTQSSEAATIPVGFGTFRVAGNFISYDKENFQAIPVYQEAEGGKGGSDPVQTGFKYRLSFDVGLCMGPVDAVYKVQGSPGNENVLWDETPTEEGGDPVDQDPVDLTGGEETLTLSGKFQDGGSVEIHPGNRTQEAPSALGGDEGAWQGFGGADAAIAAWQNAGAIADWIANGSIADDEPDPIDAGMNYRDVCVARFLDYDLGGSPAPRTYLWTVQRWPVVLDSAGDPVPNFPTRASYDEADPEYWDANPAAIIWEVLTNDVWGKGMSADYLNAEEFATAARYFANNRLGASTTIGDDNSLVDMTRRFKDIFGLSTWWDGNQMRCRAAWDRSEAYSPRDRITSEDIVGDPDFSRQAMGSATNEVRVEFTNRENNWQREAATAMDLAHAEAIGGVRSIKVDAAEIGTRRAAELIAHRMLRQFAYPAAICQVKLRRTFSNLQPAGFVELILDDWRGTGTKITTFWRVVDIEDDESGEGILTVTLQEDVYATAVDGEISDFTAPIPSIDFDDPLDNEDLTAIDYTVPTFVGEITPILFQEPNIIVSRGNRVVMATIQRRNRQIQSFVAGVRTDGNVAYSTLGVGQGFAITGTLTDGLGAGEAPLIRGESSREFRIALSRTNDEGELLEAASGISLDTDHLHTLTADTVAFMIVGDEIIRIGLIEETGANEYTVRVAMRGQLGTDVAAHSPGDTFHFVPRWHRSKMTLDAAAAAIGIELDARISPQLARGPGTPTSFDVTLDGKSIAPLRPSLVSAERSTNTWTIKIRPRIHTGGAGYGPDFESELQAREADVGLLRPRLTRLGGETLTVPEYFTGGSLGASTMEVTDFTWTPPDGTDPATGIWTLVIDFDTNPASIDLKTLLNGRTSAALTILRPD